MEPITSFSGEYEFLSNFSPSVVMLDDVSYPTVENAFQAAKTLDPMLRIPFENYTPGKAKREGRKLKLQPHWEEVKYDYMYRLLLVKFKDSQLQTALLNTGNRKLVEGNYWGDMYWGVCDKTGIGENHLGKALMSIRDFYNN